MSQLQSGSFARLTVLSLFFLAFSLQLLQAQTIWTGTTSTDWATDSNWNTNSVPTATDDVSIPALSTQPVISGSTNGLAKSVEVAANATLHINSGGVLNIDGSTFRGLGNLGTVTNDGTINMGLVSYVNNNGIVNQNGGSFTNNGSIITDDVGNGGRSVVFTSATGIFTNNGNIDIGPSPAFGLTVLGSGFFVNNGTITNQVSSQAIRIAPQGADSPELQNNGVITTVGGIFINFGQFNNTTCAELYASGFNIAAAAATVNNSGLMSFSNPSTNNGTWNNMGTIHRQAESLIFSGSPINNDDLIILAITLTEDCGDLSPAFGVGPNLGSTVSIYTDAAATMSAGTYDSGTNTFRPNFILSSGTYNLFVKVEDANGCTYILPWNVTVNADDCPDTDGDGIDDECDSEPLIDNYIFTGMGNLPESWTCGNKNNKVLLCHGSSGNELCVSPNAVAAHLAHGDFLGPCLSCDGQKLVAPGNNGINVTAPAQHHELELFPNPASHEINIHFDRHAPTTALRITDILGRVVFEKEIEEGTERMTINLNDSQFENGLYLVSLFQGGEMKTSQLVVQR